MILYFLEDKDPMPVNLTEEKQLFSKKILSVAYYLYDFWLRNLTIYN